MADHTVQGISRIEPGSGTAAQAVQHTQHVSESGLVEAVSSLRGKGPEKVSGAESKPQAVQKNLADVRLKFQVDPDTNDITVLILDKTSNKVIRTIPPDEIKNLREGGLVELLT